MPIKRRFTQSALRKELQTLCEMPHGQAKETLRREGKFWYSDFDECEAHCNGIRDVFEDDAFYSEPKKEGKEARYVLKPSMRDEIENRAQKLLDTISELSDRIEELEERINA